MKKRIASAALALSFALPAQAHEAEPLPAIPSWTVEHWRQQWATRAAPALSLELIGEWRWMRDIYFPGPERRSSLQPQKATPRPSNPASTTSQAYGPGVEQWRSLVAVYWPDDLVEWALRIMACESGGDPWAENPHSTAAGLFQFLRSTWDRGPAPALGFGSYDSGAVFNPEWNIMAAAWLYQNWGGASQWTCRA